MKLTIDIACGRLRCERCHLYSTVAKPGKFDDGWQLGITTKRKWFCSAIPQTLESDTDDRPLRSEACKSQEVEG